MVAAKPDEIFEIYSELIMKVSSLVNLRSEKPLFEEVQKPVEAILKAAFEKAKAMDKIAIFDNTFFIYMGLLKV